MTPCPACQAPAVDGLCRRCRTVRLLETALGDYSPDQSAVEQPATVGARFGKYEILEELGHGGMGVVYRARHVELGNEVALKVIRADRLAQLSEEQRREWIDRFHLEGKLVAGMDDARIVPARDFDRHEDQPFFVMNYMGGGSLAKRIGKLDCREAAELVAAAARGVDYAHQSGVIHLDLKPANILLDAAGRPRVADFGLARRLSAQPTETGGTPLYMAPEQLAPGEKPLTTRVDVYALGAILYECLTGRPPFPGKDAQEVRRQVEDLTLKPVPPRDLNPDIERDLEEICLKCLKKNPDERYPSAAALADDLERWLAGRETVARPWSRPYRALRWIGRNWGRVTLAALALVMLATFDAYSAYELRDERVRQVSRSNALTARSVANTFQARLQLLSSGVVREANGDALREDLKAGNGKKLQTHVEGMLLASNGFWRQRKDYPVESWFILDPAGTVVAHAGAADPAKAGNVVGASYPHRDYFRGALRKTGAHAYHVSRVYRAGRADENYKFAVSAPIRDGDTTLGVLVATVTTNSARETLLPEGAAQDAVLLARWDGAPPHGELHAPGQRLTLLHSAFARGDMAAEVPDGPLFDEEAYRTQGHATDAHYADPVGARDPAFAGRWLAAAAPVEDTEFVVIVKQRYDEAVQPGAIFGRLKLMWGLVIALALVGAALMARAWWKEGHHPLRG